jgi:hypothetical protein
MVMPNTEGEFFERRNQTKNEKARATKLGTTLTSYIRALETLGKRGVDAQLSKGHIADIAWKRANLAPPVDWELLKEIVPETFSVPGEIKSEPEFDDRISEFTELATAMRCKRSSGLVQDEGPMWMGDWYGAIYTIRFETNNDTSMVKPLVKVSVKPCISTEVGVSGKSGKVFKVEINEHGECNHLSCPMIEENEVIPEDRLVVNIDEETWITTTKIK